MAELNPIQLPSVADVVYDVLRKQILHGRLAPNQQLNLHKLESDLDVSRTPLKMALARLQNEGLVVIHPRRGTYVTEFAARDIEECFELRIALEAQALRYAFHPKNESKVRALIDLLTQMDGYFQEEETWLDQLIEYMDLDRQLHINFVELCDNTRMKQAYEHANVQGYIAIMGARFFYSDVQKTQAEHRRILAVLDSGDSDGLLEAARTHLEGAKERALIRLTEKEGDAE